MAQNLEAASLCACSQTVVDHLVAVCFVPRRAVLASFGQACWWNYALAANQPDHSVGEGEQHVCVAGPLVGKLTALVPEVVQSCRVQASDLGTTVVPVVDLLVALEAARYPQPPC